MATLNDVTLNIGITLSNNGKTFVFEDTTGTYNSSTNPGGYGGPNIDSSDVTQAIIGVYQYKATVPWLFTFTIASNVVSALVLTKPDETTVNIFADLTNTAFPFTGSSVFNILNTYLDYPEDIAIADMVWTFTYEISGAYLDGSDPVDFDITTSCDFLVWCNTDCCVKKMFVNLGCNCCEDKLQSAMKAKAMLLSAIYSAEVGQYDAAQKSLTKASDLCACGCKGC